MRSDEAGSPTGWPRGMQISTIVYGRQLLTLLFVRARLGIETEEDVPVLDGGHVDALTEVASDISTVSRWNRLWGGSWSEISRTPISESPLQGLRYSPTDDERWDIESWGLDEDSLNGWIETLRPVGDREYLDSVEYRGRQSLEIAWRGGLTTIVVLPYEGHYHRRRNRSVLEMSVNTYLHESSFRTALIG